MGDVVNDVRREVAGFEVLEVWGVVDVVKEETAVLIDVGNC